MGQRWTLGVVLGVVLALGFCQAIGAYDADIQRWLDEGEQAYNAANYPESLAKWQQGLELAKKSGNQKAIGDFSGWLGLVCDDLGQYDQALKYQQQALAIYQELKDRRSQGKALKRLGVVYWNLGQYDRGLKYHQQALDISREIQDRKGEGDALTNLGVDYWNLGQYDRALKFYQQALAISREIKDRKGEGDDLNNLGVVYQDLGKYDQALEYHHQALAIYQELKDRKEGGSLNNLGVVYNNLGKYDQALECYQQALAISREIKDRQGEGDALVNLGSVYGELAQYDKALEYSQQALAIYQEIRHRRNEGAILTNLGLVYACLGQLDLALEYHQQALAIHREFKDRQGEGDDLLNLGLVYGELAQYNKALEHLQQALAISREIKDRRGEGGALINLSETYQRLGQYGQALEVARESLKVSQEVGAPELIWRVHRLLGVANWKLDSHGEAIKHYQQALDTIEGLRAGLGEKASKTTYMQNKLLVYDELLELLGSLHEKYPDRGYDRDALEIFERKQGRLFLEEMGQSGARRFTGLPEQVRSQETALEIRLEQLQSTLANERSQPQPNRQHLQTLENELQQARAAFKTLKVELQTGYPDYYALKYPQPAKLAELQTKILNPGEVMLVYGVLEDEICLWVIGKEIFRLHTLSMGENDLSKKIAAFRQTLLETGGEGRGVAGERGKAGKEGNTLPQELYRLLVPPQVRQAMSPGSRLYIIPTGPLYSLPFEALETQAPGQPPHYLVEDSAIAYLSSASLLRTLREAQARKQAQPHYPLLAFANPRYGKVSGAQEEDKSVRGLQTRAYLEIMRGSFAELPETEDEARAIKELLKAPEQSNPLIVKEAASRSTVLSLNQAAKLPDYRYLVFACHGILPGEVNRVVQPALVLAFPEKDGFLTMADVFGLRLNAELVSLSACNTGRGSDVKGEGVIGLTRAFMYAGTPAVAVTLWSVESESAKELNVGMYRYLSQGQGRAQALREIKLAMLRGEKGDAYRYPFFWAPLVVFGDGQ